MKKEYSDKDIKKAIEQANANLEFEEVILEPLEKENNKVLRKELKYEQRDRSNNVG